MNSMHQGITVFRPLYQQYRHPHSGSKVQAINKAPRPGNVSQPIAFLALMKYYSKFISQAAFRGVSYRAERNYGQVEKEIKSSTHVHGRSFTMFTCRPQAPFVYL